MSANTAGNETRNEGQEGLRALVATDQRGRSGERRSSRMLGGVSLASVPFYPLLFAAYPVLLLYSNNLGEIRAAEVVGPLVLVTLVAALGLVGLAKIWGNPGRAAIVVAAGAITILAYGYLRQAIALTRNDGAWLPAFILLAGFFLVLAASRRLAIVGKPLTQGFNVVALLLVTMVLIPILTFSGVAFAGPASPGQYEPAPVVVSGERDGPDRDVYFLIFDRYGSNKALEAGYGIDNHEFTDWLREQGFQVLDDSRANYQRSNMSISASLTMSLLDGLVAQLGPDNGDYGPMYERIRRSRAGAFFQTAGYDYYHLGSWYGPTRESDIADLSVYPDSNVTFTSTLFDQTIMAGLLEPFYSYEEMHRDTALFQLEALKTLAMEPGPKFVFAHLLIPHPPYVFLENGDFSPELATFDSQLRFTNVQIREFLAPFLALPEAEQPIIILQADEGPFPSRYEVGGYNLEIVDLSDDELVTKYGILNAMLLPGPEGLAPLPEKMTPVNALSEVLRRYFGAVLPSQPDLSYMSTTTKPYDLSDVTDWLDRSLARAD